MKKLFVLLTVAVLWLGACSVALAADAAVLEVKATVNGNVASYSFELNSNQAAGFDLALNYDRDSLTPQGITRGSAAGPGIFSSNLSGSSDPSQLQQVKAVWVSSGAAAAAGNIFTVNFTLAPGVTQAPTLTVSGDIADVTAESISYVTSGAAVQPAPAADPSTPADPATPTTPTTPTTPAVPTVPTTPTLSFSDVRPGDWFYSYVTALSSSGVVSGYPDGSFRPQAQVSCGEALKLVLLAAGYAQQTAAAGQHWASGYAQLALSQGLLDAAIPDLDAAMLRQAVAELAARALKLPTPQSGGSFADSNNSSVQALFEAGIVIGSFDAAGQRLYYPNTGVTRAEISTIIWRIEQYQPASL